MRTDLATSVQWHRAWRRRFLALSGGVLLGLQSVVGATFVNQAPITIQVAGGPPGVNPYPSTITVSGLSGTIADVSVTLSNLSHTYPDALDILLVGPGGQKVMLMSDAGGDNAIVNPVRLIFSDNATLLPPDSNRIVPGTYHPWNYAPLETGMPSNAPAGPYGTNLSVFDGTSPNGSWRLFVADDLATVGSGSIGGGWHLNLSVVVFPPVIVNQPEDQVVPLGGTAIFQVGVTGTPPFGYQWLRNGQVFIPFGQGGPRLVIGDVTASDVGVYSVIISNAASPNGVRSDNARLTLAQPVTIVSQPQDQAVPPGGTAVFQVGVTGTPPFDYQWLRNGQIFVPFGQGSPTLTIPNVNAADLGVYSVIVRNAASPNGVPSDDARLVFAQPVVIVSDPKDQTVSPGGTATFQVVVSGTPPFGYQWLRNGQVLASTSQIGPTLTISNVTASDAGYYSVVVNNAASPNGVRSAEAFLNVIGPLTIVQPPRDIVVLPGADVEFCVTAAGRPPIRYQWTLNGQVLSDQTDHCFVLRNVEPKSGGNFQVIVYNGEEAITTQPAILVVRADFGLPPTDKFDDRPSHQGLRGTLQGDNSRAGTEPPAEPVLRGGGRSVWFQWFAPDTGIVTFGARGSSFDTLLGVYTGTKLEQLVPVVRDDDRGGFYTSSLQFNAERGKMYQIQLDGFGLDGVGGPFTVCWELEPTEALIPIILEEPTSQSVRPGGTARFRVLTDAQLVQYQWFFKGIEIPGATDNVLTVVNARSANVGLYRVRISNQFRRELFSETVNLQIGSVNLPVTQDKIENVYFALRNRASGGGGGFSAAAGGSLGAGYFDIGLGNAHFNQFAIPGEHQPFESNPCGGAFTKTLGQGVYATNTGSIQINTIGSPNLARVGVYHLTGGLSDLAAPAIKCDLSSASNGLPVILQFDAHQGSNYLVLLDGYDAESGNIELNCIMGTAPPLTNPLRYCFVSAGGSILLSMPATNWFPLPVCQWRRDGIDLPGATGPTLLVDNFSGGDVGTYSVRVSNFVSTVTRDVAYLALAGPFQLSRWWTTNGTDVGFVINASNSTPFVLEASTDLNGSWLPIATNPDPCLILLYTNLGALTYPQRFFRAAPWPPIGP